MSLSRKEVLQKTGELYTLSHLINLSSHLLDTPDFYWDRDDLEKLYLKSVAYFNVQKRTQVPLRVMYVMFCDCIVTEYSSDIINLT